jgi:hypothetical protein
MLPEPAVDVAAGRTGVDVMVEGGDGIADRVGDGVTGKGVAAACSRFAGGVVA